ncbi:MAG: proteasome accessory factor PafA2 family protein [bacterium]|nr:proteasome accessory factor PafA2 family protein [bacterium]
MPPELRRLRSVPKLVGADFELGNFILGLEARDGTGREASRALLAEVDGVPAKNRSYRSSSSVVSYDGFGGEYGGAYGYGWGDWYGGSARDPQDQGRVFLESNGASVYIDLDHLECAVPEVLSAFDLAAASAAMLRIAREAQVRANEKLPAGQSLQVLINNSDSLSHSYGSHLNFLVSRAAWEDILERRPHFLQFLATHQLSSMIYSGQGKVGSENGRPDVNYQISQRADFLETVAATQTTFRRPIVNARDETLCGDSGELARLHCISFDNTLCFGASILKVGAMQIVLAMIEAEDVDTRCSVDDLVGAAVAWSHDPSLERRVRRVEGGEATAIETQQRILEHAFAHRDRHGFETVPRADEILALWDDTLSRLAGGDRDALAGRIDWILKERILERALEQRDDLDWKSPELKYLDQIYSSLDPEEGLFWPHLRSGLVERWISEEEIERFLHEPPENTRAWTRAMVLRRFERHEILKVDWDEITILLDTRTGRQEFTLRLDDPLGFTRATSEALFERETQTPEGDSNANA